LLGPHLAATPVPPIFGWPPAPSDLGRSRPPTAAMTSLSSCPTQSPFLTDAIATDPAAPRAPESLRRPRHRQHTRCCDRAVSALGARALALCRGSKPRLGQAEPSRPCAEADPILCTVFNFLISFRISKNSFKFLKFIENKINVIKI
jgi:hypothetical protein